MTDQIGDKQADTPQSPLLERAEALREYAKTTATQVSGIQAQLNVLMQVPEEGAVTVAFDERGYLASMVIDPERRSALDGAGLVREINFAVARAGRPQPAQTAARDFDSLNDIASLLGKLLSGGGLGMAGEPMTYRNDLGNVTIMTAGGALASIDCEHRWIESSSEASIVEEIMRVSTEALRADDPLGLRKGPV